MKKRYEKPDLEQVLFQASEAITGSIVAQAMFGFFDDDAERRQTKE